MSSAAATAARGLGLGAALALALAPLCAGAAPCPDGATVEAARLVEFETMMMDVSVRCSHVGITISSHLGEMSAAHVATFAQAHDRVAAFLRSLPAPASAAAQARSGGAPTGAKPSRRTDPYDRYLTMIGNQYGAGITTPQRCRAFDAIAVSLSEKVNTDRLLTMVSESLIGVTLLESIVNCPPRK